MVQGEPEWSSLIEKTIARERHLNFADMNALQRALRPFHPSQHERDRRGDSAFWMDEVHEEPTMAPATEAVAEEVMAAARSRRRGLSLLERLDRLPRRARSLAFIAVLIVAFALGVVTG